MPGTNETHRDGQTFSAARPPLPPGVTTLSACTERDPSGKVLQRCADSAIFSIRSDATEFFGIVDEAHLRALEDAARAAHAYAWSVATRQAHALRLHEYQGMGMGGGLLPGLRPALRQFPSALLGAAVCEETDPRDVAATIAQAATGGHALVEAALALGAAHVAAVGVARDFVSEEAGQAYQERTMRYDQPAHVRPVATRYQRPDCDRRAERIVNGRLVAEKALRAFGAAQGLADAALDRLGLEVGCAYSVGFSLARIVPFDGHSEWLFNEMRPEPLQRAAGLALQVAREPKLQGRPLDVEIVMGDFVQGAIVRDVPTFANVMAGSLAIRAAVHAVVAHAESKADAASEPAAPKRARKS